MTVGQLAAEFTHLVHEGKSLVEVVWDGPSRGSMHPVTKVEYMPETTYAPLFTTQDGPETLPEVVVLR